MKNVAITTATTAVLAGTALGLAGAAAAAPTGSGNAQDTVNSLQAQGYNVQLNGTATSSLSQCAVTAIHGLSNSTTDSDGRRIDPTRFTTVYVDISCPGDN